MDSHALERVLSTRLLARNTLFNLAGQLLPGIVAFVAAPILIRSLGTEQYGILTIAWVVVGYFSLFDFGLGRALTQSVAEKLGRRQPQDIPSMIWTALLFMLIFGLLGALLLILGAPTLVYEALNVPQKLETEALYTFYLLAISVPFVVNTAALRGILEAHSRFGIINALRLPMGVMTYLGPLLVLPFSRSLFWVVVVLVASRIAASLIHVFVCLSIVPSMLSDRRVSKANLRSFLSYGGWITVSNIIGPIMVTLDRFLIGSLISVASVAYYATPLDAVSRLSLIPVALTSVLFPAFTISIAQDLDRAITLFDRGLRVIFLSLFPITLILVTLSHEGLRLWLGPEFADRGVRVLQYQAIGVLLNSVALVPSAFIQSSGRPDLTARLHLVELGIYLLALWWLTTRLGIEGAALAWAARMMIDLAMLLGVMIRILPGSRVVVYRTIATNMAALLLLVIGMAIADFPLKLTFLVVAMAAFLVLAWHAILTSRERVLIWTQLQTLKSGLGGT